MRARLWLAAAVVAARVCGNTDEHRELFGCKRKKGKKAPDCVVQELNDMTWNDFTEDSPYYIMLYAPWCANCRRLVPDLKKAAKKLKNAGILVGAVNVELNPGVQSAFQPQGFPTLILCLTENPQSCSEHQDPDTDAIVHWAVETLIDLSILIEQPNLARQAYKYQKTLKPLKAKPGEDGSEF